MFTDTATSQILTEYGYPAIFLITLLRGDAVVFLAGILAQQELLSLSWIICWGFAGKTSGDLGLFFFFRSKGAGLLARFPKAEGKINTISQRLCAKPLALVSLSFFFRFLYGLRNIAPIAIALGGISPLRFVPLTLLSALLWITLVAGFGYCVAAAVAGAVSFFSRLSVIFAVSLLCLGGGYGGYRFYIWKKAKKLVMTNKPL